MNRRQRWRAVGGGWGLRIPGEPFVRLVIACGPCHRAGRDRTLAVFEMDTGSTARELWIVPRRVPGNGPQVGYSTAVPATYGSGETARFKLICGVKAGRGGKSGGGCQNTPDVPISWVMEQFRGMWAPGAACTRRALR